jgi:hypothetical protein
LQLSQEQLIEKSAIPVVRSTKQLISEFNAEKNEIQIASEIFDQGGDGLISNYAAFSNNIGDFCTRTHRFHALFSIF